MPRLQYRLAEDQAKSQLTASVVYSHASLKKRLQQVTQVWCKFVEPTCDYDLQVQPYSTHLPSVVKIQKKKNSGTKVDITNSEEQTLEFQYRAVL